MVKSIAILRIGGNNMKKLKSLVGLLIILSICTGCGTNNIDIKDYNALKDKVTLGCGLTVSEMNQTMINFIYKVYSPSNQADITTGLESLKNYMTAAEYTSLTSDMNKYKADVKTEVSNVNVRICKGKYAYSGMDTILVNFTVSSGGYTTNMILEFVINPNNKIFKHYIWTTSVKGK